MKPTPFGRYLLLDKVASGGMAEVWRAKLSGEGGFQRIVAIKKILSHVSEDADFITMFTDEAKITVQLQHSNIGQVYEFDKVDGIFYIAMEYISGKDLKTLWSFQRSRKTTVPIDLACFIVQQMAEGLDYSHRKKDNFGGDVGIVHRDVSPQNCLISWDGEVKVIDFGIAKAADKSGRTRAGTLKGKFAYMAPEQIRGLGLDGRADVFALGVCLYELVTGERGFQAESEFSLLEMVRNVEIKPPTMVNKDIPQELERIIFKALAKDREHRYHFGSDLSEDLQRFLLNRGKPPSRHDLGRFLRENFTVDYDKERLRLESYKEVQWEKPPEVSTPGTQATIAIGPPSVPTSIAAVQAAMMADESASFAGDSGAFAEPTNTRTRGNTNVNAATQTNARASAGAYAGGRQIEDLTAGRTPTRGGFAPALRAPPKAAAPAKPSMMGKVALIAGATVVVVFALALALIMVLGAKKGTLTITVVGVPTATVMLDGEPMGNANPSLTLTSVSAGPHDVIVEHEGFRAYHRTVDVEGGKVAAINASLEQTPGRIVVATEPSGAAIFVDGEDTGQKTPATLDVAGGISHVITLRMKGFHELKETQKVGPAETKELAVRLRPETIKIEIVTAPSSADVKLSGSPAGKTPLTLTWDPSLGYPKVAISKKGCETLETSIPVEDDRAEQKFPFELKCK